MTKSQISNPKKSQTDKSQNAEREWLVVGLGVSESIKDCLSRGDSVGSAAPSPGPLHRGVQGEGEIRRRFLLSLLAQLSSGAVAGFNVREHLTSWWT
jgi:hypothetical protein